MNELNRGWEMGSGWIIVIIVFIIIMVLIGMVVNQKRTSNRLKDKSPLEIIKGRFARGEISKEEFEEKRRAVL